MSDFEDRAQRAADSVKRQIDQKAGISDRRVRQAKNTVARTAVLSSMAVVAVLTASLVAIANSNDGSGPKQVAGGVQTPAFELTGALKPFEACDSALAYFHRQAPDYYRDMGDTQEKFAQVSPNAVTTTIGIPRPSAAGVESDSTTSDTSEAPGFSTTNVQENGVDEPDVIKTNGNVIIAVAHGTVRVLTANNGTPKLWSTLPAENVDNVFLSGSRVITFSRFDVDAQYDTTVDPATARALKYNAQSIVGSYDIGDIAKPKLVAKLTIDGTVLSARLVGSQVRLATSSNPKVDVPMPTYDNSGNAVPLSLDDLRADIDKTTIDQWVPSYTLTNGAGTQGPRRQLVDCTNLAHPSTFSGLDTVALTTFNVGGDLAPVDASGVAAGGQQLYATATNTYITSTDWSPTDAVSKTSVHAFTTNSAGRSSYLGSGDVDGALLNQYSLSEYDGVLRVASTTSDQRGWINRRNVVQGIVTSLKLKGNKLERIGTVSGLGAADNESITAVRFVDDQAYVVTARQTDPLYVLDLSNPRDPQVKGELKVPGFSGYLHPLANHLVFAVGQSGSASNFAAGAAADSAAPRTTMTDIVSPTTASQVRFSLFDVSDPAKPRLVGTLDYGGGTAGAQFDPQAFLYWQPRDLVIAPMSNYSANGFNGLVLMNASGDALREVGRLADTSKSQAQVKRGIVIGNQVYMLSDYTLQVDDLDSHREVASVNFNQ